MSTTPLGFHVVDVRPRWAVEGGRVTLRGRSFAGQLAGVPAVRIGTRAAHVVSASSTEVSVIVPRGVEGGRVPVAVEGEPDQSAWLDVGTALAAGLHQVDSPAFDGLGNLYVTYSGRRGERVDESLFRLRPDGTREALRVEILNPTSLAVGPDGALYVSSRFEGDVYRVTDEGVAEVFATDLGVPCGLAFGPDRSLYVGDRSGSILRLGAGRETTLVATLPPSVAAYHLAFGPDSCLYVTAPTLASVDPVYRVDPGGRVSALPVSFGRPQGLAFDADGWLYVVEALAGSSGLYRMRVDREDPEVEHVLAGPGLVGVAIAPAGGLVVATSEAVYRLDVPVKPPRPVWVA